MVAIVTREVGATAKGSPLTNAEVDNNFINLEEGKIERFVACKNETGSTAAIGTVVYITGSTGTNPIFALAAASSEATSSKTFGIVWPAAINNNAVGNVITQGIITGLNTSAYSAGAALWLSTTVGGLTATKPTQPNHSVFIGYVVRSHATEGSIQVKILNGYELDELHDVLITSPAYRQFLYRNASNTLWINGFIQDVIGAKIGSAPDEIPLNQYLGDLAYQSSKSVSIDLLNATTISSTNGATIQGLTIGRGAGAVSTNTAVGASALGGGSQTGTNNVAVGHAVMGANTSGGANIGVGDRALENNTTGSFNSGSGVFALRANTTGANNTGYGAYALYSNTTASNNTAVGYQAGYSNTTGTENTALGIQSLYSNVTGSYNTALGSKALNASTGDQNTAIGAIALLVNTSGSYNTSIGVNSGRFNTTGSNNVALGTAALYSNTTASNNTAVGYQAAYSNTTGFSSTYVGYLAGFSTTTGVGQVAMGNQALYSNTTGTTNTALGGQALYSNTTASNNTAVGYQAGYYNTGTQTSYFGTQAGINQTGSYNTGIGTFALYGTASTSSGQYNTAVGVSSLASNTTASNNTAVGYQSLYLNQTGTSNTAVGMYALYPNTASQNSAFGWNALGANTTGANNSAVGYNAMSSNTTGANNVAVGLQALQANTTASSNVAVGYQAGYSNTTGINNVVFGYQAGYTNTTSNNSVKIGYQAGYTGTGANNICIGAKAGYALTTGVSNTFVGAGVDSVSDGAGSAVTTGSKNTIIGTYSGNQGGLDIRTASNYIVLSDGDGNPRQYYDGGTTNAWWMNAPVIIKNGAVPTPTTGATTSASIGGSSGQITVGINGVSNGDYGTLLLQSRKGDSSDPLTMAALNYGGIALRGASPQTSGIGITFPATQSASSNANTLDDYEEGSFTPGVDYDGTGSLSVTYSTRAGSYTKIGNLVTISIQIRLTAFSKGSASGEMGIWGLPFTVGTASGDETFVGSLAYYDTPFNTVPICFAASNTTVIRFRSISNNAAWATQPDPDGNSQWFITLTYRTAT